MGTLGDRWKIALNKNATDAERREAESEAEENRRIAAEVINDIPARVQQAEKEHKDSIHLISSLLNAWQTEGDLDKLYARQGQGETVKASHFKPGSAPHIIIEWCVQNDLVCALEFVDIPMNDNEFNLIARPPK